MRISATFCVGFAAVIFLACVQAVIFEQSPNAARYDYYRLYRVRFSNLEQVAVFQELEAISDSCIFYGHARQIGQSLTILVAAHKIADFEELLHRYRVEHAILVRKQKLPLEDVDMI